MMNPIELQKLKERAPLPIVIAAIMFFAPGYIVGPLEENLVASSKTLESSLKNARGALHQKADDAAITLKLVDLRKRLGKVDAWLPPTAFMPNVIEEFHALSAVAGVKIGAVTYGFDQGRRDNLTMPPRIAVNLQLEGEYSAVRTFMQAIESLPFPLVPVELNAGADRHYQLELLQFVRPDTSRP